MRWEHSPTKLKSLFFLFLRIISNVLFHKLMVDGNGYTFTSRQLANMYQKLQNTYKYYKT